MRDLFIQDKCYSGVVQDVRQGKWIDLVDKLLMMMAFYVVKGRYDNIDAAQSVKYPKLLPKD